MSVIEKELPFDMTDPLDTKDQLEPGYIDKILLPEQVLKNVTPYKIKTSIMNCFLCANKNHNKPLELSNFDASIMIVGETPGDVDFKTKEGSLLGEILKWAQYDLDDVYLTSLVKCESSPTPDRCIFHLISEILCVQPKLIIALGYDVGRYFDSSITSPGHFTKVMDRFDMLSTYRTLYVMNDQNLFQNFCKHFLEAKEYITTNR